LRQDINITQNRETFPVGRRQLTNTLRIRKIYRKLDLTITKVKVTGDEKRARDNPITLKGQPNNTCKQLSARGNKF